MEEKELWKAAGQRLAQARARAGFASQKALAQAVGLSVPTIAKYEQGAREIPLKLLHFLSDGYGTNIEWIITGRDDPDEASPRQPRARITVEPATVQRLVDTMGRMSQDLGTMRQSMEPPVPLKTIQYLPLRASAGGGATVLTEPPGIDMDMDTLSHDLLGLQRKHIRLLEIKGDSMLPTLLDGDVVVVDASKPRAECDGPDEGKIYVVSIEGELYAKRAIWSDWRTLQWCSDNEQYAPITVRNDDINRIRPVGQVVWVWRPVK